MPEGGAIKPGTIIYSEPQILGVLGPGKSFVRRTFIRDHLEIANARNPRVAQIFADAGCLDCHENQYFLAEDPTGHPVDQARPIIWSLIEKAVHQQGASERRNYLSQEIDQIEELQKPRKLGQKKRMLRYLEDLLDESDDRSALIQFFLAD